MDWRARREETAIPLCLPNNCSWDSRTKTYTKTGEKRSSLYVVEEALEKLRTISGPVCVVSIAGPCRKGKSWLLSEAFNQPDVFPLGHTLDPETMGIWLWIVPDKIKDSNGKDCTVVLLDSEGINAVKGEGLDDNQIFTLTVLLASVLIYNSAGVPTRTDLEGLDFIVKLSKRIQVRSTEGGMSTASRKKDSEHFHKTFPFFIWMLRDVTQSVPEDCKDIQDYFFRRVFDARGHSNAEKSQEAAESILSFFPGFRAFHLPPPTSDPEVLMNISRNRDKINLKFLSGVQQFKGLLKSILIPKHAFNDGEIVTGEGLAALINLYVDAINTPNVVPNIQWTWERFIQHKCLEAQHKALINYQALMKSQLSDCLPCDNDIIRQAHNTSLEEATLQVQSETFGISSATVEKCLKEIKETTDKTLSSCIRENEKLTKESCNRLLVKLKRKHLDPLLARLRAAGGCKLSFDDLVQGYKRVEEEYHSDAKGAQDVCATVFFEFYPELMREMEQYLGLLRQLKDYDENLTREIAAKAYQDQERKRLEEEYARLQQENREWQKEMEFLITKQGEEKQRIHDQFQADGKAHREQLQNFFRASMKEAEEQRKAFMHQNQSLQQRVLAMQTANERMHGEIDDLQRQLVANQNRQAEVNEPGFFDKALQVVSTVAPALAAVAAVLPKCSVM